MSRVLTRQYMSGQESCYKIAVRWNNIFGDFSKYKMIPLSAR
jgi:hypothetical protein